MSVSDLTRMVVDAWVADVDPVDVAEVLNDLGCMIPLEEVRQIYKDLNNPDSELYASVH